MIDVSSRLKELRKKHGYTIQAVCDGTNIPIRTYQNYEYGKREISAEAIVKLCAFYNVTTDYLLGRTETKPDPIKQLTDEELEQNVLQEYLQLPKSVRMQILQAMSRAFECSQEAKHESQIHISRTAARNGAPPRKELLTQEEVDAIKVRPDADPDL